MSKVLRLYNSFTRSINEVKLDGRLVSVKNRAENLRGSFYICGPTVYADSHLGHAITYTRADLFRRFMKSLFNINLTTVMNITDIDDKILAKSLEDETKKHCNENQVFMNSDPDKHPFKLVGERYYKSFIADMNFIRVQPPDISVRVSQQIRLIERYIQRLEEAGYAYIGSNGDIFFRVSSIANYVGRIDSRKDTNSKLESKQDIRDFVLWKAAKPNEPVWNYKSCVTGKEVPGRPGWHVQCSAIASAIFGDRLDFHFGGKDLIFPHHYNEQACCCAYHKLDTSGTFHAWTSNWLHSGHLILRDEKMSKSLGNVMAIRDFISSTSVNALRLLCISSHYRADVNFNEDLLQNMRNLDHKLGAFTNHLSDELQRVADMSLLPSDNVEGSPLPVIDLDSNICQAYEELLEGVCDDFDLQRGLHSLLDLSKRVYNLGADQIRPQNLVAIWQFLIDWCTASGLEYGPMKRSHDEQLVNLVRDFRQSIRLLAVDELKRLKKGAANSQQQETEPLLKSILDSCDRLRLQMDEAGYVIRDKKT